MTDVRVSPKFRFPGVTVPHLQVREQTIGVGFLAFLTVGAGAFFEPVFDSWGYLLPAVAGAVFVAAFVAYLCDHFELRSGEGAIVQTVSAVLTLPGLLGLSKAKFGVPFPSAIAQLVVAIGRGPARLLTSPVPSRSGQELLVAPVATAWLGFAVGWILLRHRRVGWSLIGPVVAVVSALSFGRSGGELVLWASSLFLVGSLVYVVTLGRHRSIRNSAIELAGAGRIRARVVAGGLLLAISMAAALLGTSIPTVGREKRFSLRELRTPPFDPVDLASPLAEYSKYLQNDYAQKALFTATGTLPQRWRLATLTKYDGRVWGVGKPRDAGRFGQSTSGSDTTDIDGVYQLVGARLQPKSAYGGAKEATTTIRILDLDEPWLPSPGQSLELRSGADQSLENVRYNDHSDTLVQPTGLPRNATYSLKWAQTKPIDQSATLGRTLRPEQPQNFISPNASVLGKWADEKAPGNDGFVTVQKLKAALDSGFYVESRPPGHAFGDLANMIKSSNNLQGNGEHYAALLAVLLRSKGIYSRVVVGFEPEANQVVRKVQTVYGRNIKAWVEVEIEGVGWVPVEAIQNRQKKPKPEATKTRDSSQQDYNPSLTIPQPEPSDPVDEKLKKPKPDSVRKASGLSLPMYVALAGGVGATPIVLVSLATGVVALMKAGRRSKRRRQKPALSVSGAWEEVLERAAEAGQSVRSNMTISEATAELFPLDPEMRRIVRELSRVSERVAFSATAVGPDVPNDAWSLVDQFGSQLRSSSTTWQRVRRLANPSPLINGTTERAFVS